LSSDRTQTFNGDYGPATGWRSLTSRPLRSPRSPCPPFR